MPLPDAAELEAIFHHTLQAVEEGRRRLTELAATVRSEHERTQRALGEVKQEALRHIEQVDELEAKARAARYHLFRVSREYGRYSEEDVRRAYEEAERLQILLGEARERERFLRQRREELERSAVRLLDMLEQADALETNVSLALQALQGNVSLLHDQLVEWQARYEMGRRVIAAQERERNRFARELHDGPAQALASMAVELELCERMLHSGVEMARRHLDRLRGLVKEGLSDLRRVIFDLRPMMLDELGLLSALRRFADHLTSLGPPLVEVTIIGSERRFDPALEVAVFRVVQEAVNNARRHAAASRIHVQLEVGDRYLNVVIRDNGRGFDPEAMKARNDGRGRLGLLSMRERVELFGGRFSIQSSPGSGTRVSARFTFREG